MRSAYASAMCLMLAAALALAVPRGASAQTFQGSVRGTVSDAQGVIPGATVVLLNEATQASRQTVTNGRGEYSFPAVDPATYTLRVAVPGYRTYENKTVQVATQGQLDIPVKLEVGAIQENVTVTAAAPLIQTTTASQSATLSTEDYRELPSEGRSVFLMATLEPTVVASGNAHWNRMQDQSGNSSLSMGGGAVRSNNFLIDGFPTTDLQNRSSINPTMEALSDSAVQIHTYDAEMGRTGGGVMNMTAKSGTNKFSFSGYTVFRPTALQNELLIPKLNGEVFRPEYWRNGGGGVGGPIVKNKTFFWFAGEKYQDNHPQQSAYLVPTLAEIGGDFSGLTRKGALVPIIDPLTGQPFPGNIIPANRINFTGAKILSYFPQAQTQVDNGTQNYSYTDVLPSHAYQWTLKVNQNFSNAVSVSGFYLRQKTGENSYNLNPQNKFAGTQYYLARGDNTLVLNGTWVMNSSTVLTLRGGYNRFPDDYQLPDAFDATTLWPNNPAFTGAFTDANRFPSTSLTGYAGTGWTSRQDNIYYQYGVNGTLSRLAGSHSIKGGADYRILGVRSNNFGASTGTYTFDGTFTGNPVADLLIGAPISGNIPISTQLDGYVHYTAGFIQDDWRVNDRWTLNYGLRIEDETRLQERQNRITTDFARNTVNPLNSEVSITNPVTGAPVTLMGGLLYAGQSGAPTQQGGPSSVEYSPRVGTVFKIDDKTVLRGGWGIYVAPWNYSSAGTSSWAQYGYAATTDLQQSSGGVPITSLSDPFPNGLVQPTGQSLGMLTNIGANTNVYLPLKGTPKVKQYSVDVQREFGAGLMLGVGYTGSTGTDLSWAQTIDLNQIDPIYQAAGVNTLANVANPFYGIADAGQFASRKTIQLGQLLRPFPEFGNLSWEAATGAHSQYNAFIFQGRKRVGNLWGATFSYTYSRLNDNQVGQGNYYSRSAPVQNMYELIPWSSYYNPNAEYGQSLLDSPHKVTIAPTLLLPFGQGKKWLSDSVWGDKILGGWSITAVLQLQSGFPIGVGQNITGGQFLFGGNVRPNLVSGQPILAPGNITDRIRTDTTDNQYFNLGAFQAVPTNSYGNAPRTLPGVLSPRRTNFSMSFTKQVETGGGTNVDLRVELLNPFNIVQWARIQNNTLGNSSFGQIRSQANNMRSIQFTVRVSY
jgi:trimeric autotransporter adhesin